MKPGERWSTKETGCNRRVESQIQSIQSKNKNKVSIIDEWIDKLVLEIVSTSQNSPLVSWIGKNISKIIKHHWKNDPSINYILRGYDMTH
jgi:hypothetical protein